MCKTIVVTSASILSFFCCSTENGKGLWVVYGLGGQYHFQSVVVGYIEYFDDFAIGDCFVGIKSDESLGVVLRGFCQFLYQLVVCDRLCRFVSESDVIVQVFIDRYPCERFGRRLLIALRKVYLYGVGKDDRRGDHEEYEQQEYDIGHRCHTKRRVYFMSSFECHDVRIILPAR